jgi:hypothetical protein
MSDLALQALRAGEAEREVIMCARKKAALSRTLGDSK